MDSALYSWHYVASTTVPVLWFQHYGPSAMATALLSQCYGHSTIFQVLLSQYYGSSTIVPVLWLQCTLGKVQKILPFFCDVRKYCPSFIMGIYEKIFFLVFEVSRTKYYLYQIFDARYSFLMLRQIGPTWRDFQ